MVGFQLKFSLYCACTQPAITFITSHSCCKSVDVITDTLTVITLTISSDVLLRSDLFMLIIHNLFCYTHK